MRLSVLDLVPVRTDQSTARCAGGHRAAGADRRPAGLHALLGRRTPQHAVRGRHQPAGVDRLPGRADLAAAPRIGRRDAAQPRAAGGGRAVRAAGSGRPGPHRPRHRPGARLRPGDVVRAARHRRRSRHRELPRLSRRRGRADERARRAWFRCAPGTTGSRPPRPRPASRGCGCSARRCTRRSWPPPRGCRTCSPITSPARAPKRRSSSTAPGSSPAT